MSAASLGRGRVWLRVLAMMQRNGAAAAALIGAAGVVIACSENFVTGPIHADVTLALRNWSDTLVLGDRRPVEVVVRDAQGREVVGAKVRWTIATSGVLDAQLGSGTAPSVSSIDAVSASDVVQLSSRKTGTTQIAVSLVDPRFDATALSIKATVVAAGVRVLGVHETTVTSLGDTSLVLASALGRADASPSASLFPVASQGLTWTRLGAGAVALVGTGDSVRAVALRPGTDTLVATHAFCLRGARCSDSMVVHVSQVTQPFTMPTDTLRAWSFGDTVTSNVAILDARGNAITGVYLVAVPLTSGDSAIIGVGTTVGVPSFALFATNLSGSALHSASPLPAPGAIASPALVARANGTAHVALQARAADGRVLGTSQIVVIVRQVAKSINLRPDEAEVTPGDSIPILLQARDARGHLIADATFSGVLSSGVYRAGRVLVSTNAVAGTDILRAVVTGVAAPSNNAGAPISDPAAETAKVNVRTPLPVQAGDTTSVSANLLTAIALGADGKPLVGVWVRFGVPAGSLVGTDSVLSDANGLVQMRWLLPTTAGRYTATAFLLGVPAPTDSAGVIILRSTSTVIAGPPSRLVVTSQSGSTAMLGATLASPLTVQLFDAYGNRSTQAGVPVTVSVSGGAGFTLNGTLTVLTNAFGQAQFSDLSGSGIAGVRVLTFSSPSGTTTPLTAAAASPIDFVSGAISALAITSGNGQSGVVAQTLAAQIVVTASDALGNPLAGIPVTFAAQNGGSVGVPTTVTAMDGTARTTWTLGQLAGAQNVTVTSTAIAGSTSFNATATPAVWSALTSTMTAGVGVVASNGSVATSVTIVMRDVYGNPTGISAGALSVTSSGSGVLSPVINAMNGTYTFVVTTPSGGSATPVSSVIGGVAASQPVVVPAAAAVVSLATSTLVASPTSLIANGTSTSAITVTLKDVSGNLYPQSAGTLLLTATSGSLSLVVDNADGTYSAHLTAPTTLGTSTVSGTIGGIALPSTAQVIFVSGPVSPAQTVVTAASSTVIGGTSPVTVVLKDASGNPVIGAASSIALSATLGTLSSLQDNGDGSYTATFTAGATSGTATVSAVVGGQTFVANLLVNPAAVSLSQSTVAASPTAITVGGASTITVQLRDASGNALTTSGGVVVLNTSAGTLTTVTDHGNGSYTATLTAPATPSTITVSGTVGGAALTATATITASVGTASLTQSTLVASPTAVTVGGASTITVQLRDASGNAINTSGGIVALSATTGSLSTVTDNGNGSYTATLTAPATPGTTTVSGTLAGSAFTATATITTFVGAASLTQSTLVASPTAVTVGGSSTITVQLRDASGNALTASGGVVALSTTAGSLSAVTDNGNGSYSATLTAAATPGTITVSGTVAGAALTATATITASVGTASLTQSTLIASPTAITVGSTSTITVQLRDASGNALTTSGGVVALTTSSGTLTAVTDHANGSYSATLTAAATPGTITVTGTLGGNAITATATVATSVGAPSAVTSTLVVSSASLTVGDVATLTIVLRDAAGNVLAAAVPSDVTVATTLGTLGAVSCGSGICTASYTATTAGTASITARIGGAHIGGSPAAVTIAAAPVVPSLTQSTLVASPTAITVGGSSTITVQLRDASGNALTASGGVVVLNTSAGTLTAVTDHANGSYTATLTAPATPGTITVSGTLGGATLTATATITASVGSASLTQSTLVASPTAVTVGGTSTITVQLRDASGNALTTSGGVVALNATAGSLSTVTDLGNGSYSATLTAPVTPGTLTVTGTLAGNALTATASIAVSVGSASLTQSTLVASPTAITVGGTSTITVQLRDASGNALTASGGVVALSATAGSLSAVTDHANGSYTATLTAPATPGTITVSGTLAGAALTATATISTSVGTASLTQSTLVASPTAITVGGSSTITVQLRDASGNALTASGGTVALSATTGSLSAVTDHANGSYTATLTAPATPGTITISGTLAGSALTATATITTSVGAPSAAASTLAVSATSLAVGQSATITIIIKDAAGNVLAGAIPGDVTVGATLGTLSAVSCTNGTCVASYTATTAGAAAITARIGGTHIGGSPAAVTITSTLTTTQAVPSVVLTQNTSYPAFTPVTAAGGSLPYTFALNGGTLPSGMSFAASTGTISSTATTTLTTTTFTVSVTDAAAAVSFKTFDLTVNAALVTTQAVPSTTLTVATAYSAFAPVTASGGTAPLTFALTGGPLPAGVSFNTSTGVISGTATASLAITTFTVTVTDAVGAASARTFDLAANGPPTAPAITVVTAGDAQLTVAFSPPTSDGGTAITNYEYSIDNGATWTTRSPVATTTPIVISGLTNGTTYQVRLRAVNASGVGVASVATSATPATTPSAPAITSIVAGNAQLSVAFTAPAPNGGSAITNYEYSTDNGSTWTARSPVASTSPLVIAGLTNGTTYQVKLRAVNAVGSGATSGVSSGTPATVPDAPTNLLATGGNASAALTWTAPVVNGGSAITNYIVEYSANAGASWSTFSHATSTTAAITVTGLTNGTAYQFRVSAVNTVGTGATSPIATATPGTPGSPTAVTIAFNQQSATALDGLFSWTAPASSGATAISDYVIEYKTSASSTWTTFVHAASTATSAIVPGLVPSTTYNVRISAKNSVGTGAPSAIATATTNGPSSRLACFQPGNSNSSANSITIAPCAGTAVGNIILIPVVIANSSPTVVTTISQMAGTAGFTALGTQLNGSNQTTIFYKIADASDVGRATPYGFSWSGNVKNAISLVTYKTTDGLAPAYLSTSGTGATATSPAVTVSGVSDYTLVYVYTMVGVALSSTTPTVGEWSVSSDLWKNTTAGANNALAAAITTTDVDKFAAGTTAGRDATTSSMTGTTKWNAAVLVLRPTP